MILLDFATPSLTLPRYRVGCAWAVFSVMRAQDMPPKATKALLVIDRRRRLCASALAVLLIVLPDELLTRDLNGSGDLRGQRGHVGLQIR